jgi:hypothetical protein
VTPNVGVQPPPKAVGWNNRLERFLLKGIGDCLKSLAFRNNDLNGLVGKDVLHEIVLNLVLDSAPLNYRGVLAPEALPQALSSASSAAT